MSEVTSNDFIIAIVYGGNKICGVVITPAQKGSPLLNENAKLGLHAPHMVYLDDKAVEYLRSNPHKALKVEDSGEIVFNCDDKQRLALQRSIPAIEKQHLMLTNIDRYCVIGIPIAFDHRGRLNMLLFGKNVKPYYDTLLKLKKVSSKHSDFKGFDMAVIRNINMKYITPDVVSGKFKLFVNTTFFDANLSQKWWQRSAGTFFDFSKQANNGPASAKVASNAKAQLDMITQSNLSVMQNSLLAAKEGNSNKPISGKYGPNIQKYMKHFKVTEEQFEKDMPRLMTLLEASDVARLEERIVDLL